MAYNNLSGTVLQPAELIPRSDAVVAPILSGNLSTSDAAEVINIPRVSNATNNSLITNVGGDANSLTCESNLTFDGDTLSITGDLTASVGASLPQISLTNLQPGALANERSYLGIDSNNRIVLTSSLDASGSTPADSFSVYGIGDSNGNLSIGFNYGSAAFTDTRTWTTPSNPTIGGVVKIKAPDGVSSANKLVVEGYADHTIDGQANISIESPYGAVSLCYVSSGSYRIF